MDLQLLSQCGSTCNCLSRSAPEIHSHVAGTLSNQPTNISLAICPARFHFCFEQCVFYYVNYLAGVCPHPHAGALHRLPTDLFTFLLVETRIEDIVVRPEGHDVGPQLLFEKFRDPYRYTIYKWTGSKLQGTHLNITSLNSTFSLCLIKVYSK